MSNAMSFQLRNFDEYTDDLNDFFICSAGGYRPKCKPIGEELRHDGRLALVLTWIAITLLALLSWVNLFFVIQISDIKNFTNKVFKNCTICWK